MYRITTKVKQDSCIPPPFSIIAYILYSLLQLTLLAWYIYCNQQTNTEALNSILYSDFLSFPPKSFSCSRTPFSLLVTFSCHVSLGSSRLTASQIFLVFHDMAIWVPSRYLVECFHQGLDWGYTFSGGSLKIPFSSHQMKGTHQKN